MVFFTSNILHFNLIFGILENRQLTLHALFTYKVSLSDVLRLTLFNPNWIHIMAEPLDDLLNITLWDQCPNNFTTAEYNIVLYCLHIGLITDLFILLSYLFGI